jgi:hypothetical protein
MKGQHPLVRRFVVNGKRWGAAIYAGEAFATVRFEDGNRYEIRVTGREESTKKAVRSKDRFQIS